MIQGGRRNLWVGSREHWPIPQPLYRSVCRGQAQCWSPSHSSSTPASRSPSLKDKSSSSRHVLVLSTAARSRQQALVMREYRSLVGTPGSDPQNLPSALIAIPPWWPSPPSCRNLGAPRPGGVGQRQDATPWGLFWGTSPAPRCWMLEGYRGCSPQDAQAAARSAQPLAEEAHATVPQRAVRQLQTGQAGLLRQQRCQLRAAALGQPAPL